MQNLEWVDKTDKKSEIEAKDVNSLANAIITIIDWINQGGADVDLSEYVKKEEGKGLSKIADISFDKSFVGGDGTEKFIHEVMVTYSNGETDFPITLYDTAEIDKKFSELPSGGGNVDLSDYYNKAETNSLLNKKLTAGIADYYVSQLEVDNQGTIEVRDENDTIQLSIKVPSNSVDSDTNTVDLSAVCTKTEIEAYIEETLLGGAW